MNLLKNCTAIPSTPAQIDPTDKMMQAIIQNGKFLSELASAEVQKSMTSGYGNVIARPKSRG